MQSKNTYKIILILTLGLYLNACKYDDQTNNYSTICVDEDTSIKNDIPNEGIRWSLTTQDLKDIKPLLEKHPYDFIYARNSITTCELSFEGIEIDGRLCNVHLNAGAYGITKCGKETEYSFGCYDKKCNKFFPFPFVEQE